jgi:membrane-associated phospholipid phosphatase
MKKIIVCLLLCVCISSKGFSQDTSLSVKDTLLSVNEPVQSDSLLLHPPMLKKEPVYKLKLAIDLPVTIILDATTLYGFSKIYNKPRLTNEELASLNPKNVNRFDRSAIKHFDNGASRVGDFLFYGSQPLPLLLLLDKRMRKDFPKLVTLYLETMGVTGIIYVSAVHFGDRYRPYAYNPKAPIEFRTRGGARNSFYAGHPALVGTASFFMATVLSDYHPEWKNKWILYTVAGAMTAGTATARYLGGRHFPTDLLIGVTLGPLSGILIPHIHRNKDLSKRKTAIMPYFGESSGLVMVHKF